MRFYHILGIILFALALVVLLMATIQKSPQQTIVPFDLGKGRKGSLTVSVPSVLRAGDPANVSILVSSLPIDNVGSSPKNLDLIGRFEIGDLELEPKGEIHAAVQPGGFLLFNWRLRTARQTKFSGNLWLFFVENEKEPELIYVREVSFESKRLLGLTYGLARVAAVFGLLIGGIMNFSLFFGTSKKQSTTKI